MRSASFVFKSSRFRLRLPFGILPLAALAFSAALLRAEESEVDFESLSPELPGWSATVQRANNEAEYRVAAKWDAPIAFSLDSENPHSGSVCLKCDIHGELSGDLSFGPGVLAASGSVEVRFFVRSQGLNEEGFIAFEESSGPQRIAGYWTKLRIPVGEEWQEVVWSGQLKPEASGIRLRMVFKSVPTGAKIWIDDISVKTVEN